MTVGEEIADHKCGACGDTLAGSVLTGRGRLLLAENTGVDCPATRLPEGNHGPHQREATTQEQRDNAMGVVRFVLAGYQGEILDAYIVESDGGVQADVVFPNMMQASSCAEQMTTDDHGHGLFLPPWAESADLCAPLGVFTLWRETTVRFKFSAAWIRSLTTQVRMVEMEREARLKLAE